MKRSTLFILVFFIGTVANAQISKGKFLLGGQLGLSSSKFETQGINNQSTFYTFGISLGKVYKENTVIGANVSIAPYKQTFTSTEVTGNSNNLSVFYREYKQLGKAFYFFSEAEAGYSGGVRKENNTIGTNLRETKFNGGFLSFTPGIAYQAFKKCYLEITIPNILGLRYTSTKLNDRNTPANNSTNNDFQLSTNLRNPANLGFLGVGMRFLL